MDDQEVQDSRPLTAAQTIARIQAALGGMVASERRVAEVVLADPRDVIGCTASQLAARANTSATTVIRFARSAGFAGFQELGIALAIAEPELGAAPLALSDQDTPAETLRAVSHIASQAVSSAASAVDEAAFVAAVGAIASAGHVLCVGAGLTLPVATDLAYRLGHLGLLADAPADRQVQRILAGNLRAGDVCVAILHGGTYPHVVGVARDASAAGATVVALTSFVRTPLAELADHALVVGARTTGTGIAAWSARLALLTVIDALTIAIRNTDPERYTGALERIYDLIEQDQL